MSDKDQTARLFAAYLSTKRILIVDPNGPARAGMAKMMVGLGAKTNHLVMVNDFASAKHEIATTPPDIVITEYQLEKGSGLDLAAELIQVRKGVEKLFVLITSNSSQSLVAQAAEEDVDIFILKPYTAKYFNESMTRAVLSKIYPSDYIKTIEVGKKLLKESKPDEAIQVFDKAIGLNPKPSLAFFYKGQAELFKKLLDSAEHSYNDGLKWNEIHYKCLTGLFDLLLDRNKLTDAYTIVRKISKYFPSNPKRLSQVVGLAVRTGNLEDIEEYYEVFKEIEVRNDELVRYICAALVVCGRQFLQNKETTRGLDLLKKASISAAGRSSVLLEIITTLVEHNYLNDARLTLKRFSTDSQNDLHYQAASFLIAHKERANSWHYVLSILKMFEGGSDDPALYYWAIAMLNASKKSDQAENYRNTAINKWPEKTEYFNGALTAVPSNANSPQKETQ